MSYPPVKVAITCGRKVLDTKKYVVNSRGYYSMRMGSHMLSIIYRDRRYRLITGKDRNGRRR